MFEKQRDCVYCASSVYNRNLRFTLQRIPSGVRNCNCNTLWQWCTFSVDSRKSIEMKQCQDVEFSSGTNGSRKEEKMWKMTPGVGDRQQARLKKILSECGRRCAATAVWLYEWFANELSVNSERVWTIITEELGMRKICAKMIRRLLTDEQKEQRVEVCQDILTRLETDPNLLGRTITGDESWDLPVRSIHQATEPWVEESNITKAKESEGVQVQSQSDVDRFLWCEGKCSQRVLTSRPNHQSAHLQRHPVAFDAVSAWEKARIVGWESTQDFSSRQCPITQCFEHPGIPCQK